MSHHYDSTNYSIARYSQYYAPESYAESPEPSSQPARTSRARRPTAAAGRTTTHTRPSGRFSGQTTKDTVMRLSNSAKPSTPSSATVCPTTSTPATRPTSSCPLAGYTSYIHADPRPSRRCTQAAPRRPTATATQTASPTTPPPDSLTTKSRTATTNPTLRASSEPTSAEAGPTAASPSEPSQARMRTTATRSSPEETASITKAPEIAEQAHFCPKSTTASATASKGALFAPAKRTGSTP